MTLSNPYLKFHKEDDELQNENILNLAPSQNIDKENEIKIDDTDVNPYAKFHEQDEQNMRNQVKANLQLVIDKDPDKVGEASRLADELGLPKEFALNSDQAVTLMIEKQRRDRLEELEFARDNSPVLYKQLTDPTFAALANDNLANLEGLERLFKSTGKIPENIGQGWAKGRLQVRRGRIGTKAQFGLADEEDFLQIAEIDKRLEEYARDGTGIFEEGFAIFGQYSKTLPYAVAGGTTGAITGGLIGAGTGSVAGGVGAIPGAVAGAKSGWVVGFMSTLAADSYAIEAGSMYLDLLDEGLDKESSKYIAAGVGVTNAALELVGLGFVTAPIRKTLAKQTTKVIAKELIKPSRKLALKNLAKNYLLNNTYEGLTEVGQELANVIGRDLAITLQDSDLEKDLTSADGLGRVAVRLGTTFARTMQGMVLVGLPGSVYSFSYDLNKSNQAKEDSIFFENLATQSANSKLKERNPRLFNIFAQQLGDENGIKEFYLDAQTLLNVMNSRGLTMEDVNAVSPEVAKQLTDASKNGTLVGTDIIIPTGDYAAKFAGTEIDLLLQDHLRKDKDTFSRAENTNFLANKEKLKKEAIQVLANKNKESSDFSKSANKVKKDFVNMLKGTGRFKTQKSLQIASNFYRDYVITQSNKLGILPEEFAKRFPYKVVSTDQVQISPQEQLFNQNGTAKTDTAQFLKFIGKSVFKDKNDNAEILYHGTQDNINEFDVNHPNKKDIGAFGKGIYLVRGKDAQNLAASYETQRKGNTAQDVLPLYVRLENPYYATIQEKIELKRGGETAANGFQERLKELGHDGIIMEGDNGNQEVVVFDNNQIRSLTESNTWATDVADIIKQQDLINEEIFAQRTQPQEQGKPIPDTIFDVANLEAAFNFAKGKSYKTNRDFKIAIQKLVVDAAKKASVDVKEFTAEVEKYLVKTVLADAKFALIENSNAVGWYNEKVSKAKALLALIHPELATEPEANFAFTWALANTSNGIKVDKNFQLAEEAYSYYIVNGKFPTKIGIGDAADAINRNFKLFNRLIEEKGFESFENFMKTTHTVKEVEAYTNDEVSGETQGEIVYGAAVMGPKIGNGFFANLYGNYEQLTMDRWLMRTWGRMRGELVIDYSKQAKVKRGQLKELIKALSLKDKKKLSAIIKVKVKLSNLDEVAVAIQKASTSDTTRKKINEIATIKDQPDRKQFLLDLLGPPQKRYPHISIGGEIRKGGNALAKYLDGQKEAPKGAPERRNIRKVFSQVLTELQQTQKDLTMADLQALLWYPERRLYDAAKLDSQETNSGYEDNEAPDYANAAESLARQQGVTDADIQTTLQEVDNELERQAIERTRRSESGEGGTGGIREVNTFQQQGRIDESTGLPLNTDGTVTVYHHTNKRAADNIRKSSELRSAGEPDVYVTTRTIPDTGYGDTSVGLRVNPSRLKLDDEFPNGRKDFRLSVGKPRGSIRVDVIDLEKESKILSQQQIPGNARGGFDPKTLTAFLSKESDMSTFLHETAHFMLTVHEDLVLSGQATTEMQNDFNVLLNFWGVKDVDTWSKLTLKQKRKYHEAFAYNYEIYITEQKAAPSIELQNIFREFTKYLTRIYNSISGELNDLYREENGTDLPVLTDEVRSVMDRMLASQEAITQAEQIYGMKPMFATQQESGMDDATWKQYTDAIKEYEDLAIESLTKASMRQIPWIKNKIFKLEKQQQKQIEKIRKKVTEEITKDVENERLYKLQNFLKRGLWNDKDGTQFESLESNKIDIKDLKNLVPFYDMASEIKKLGTGQYGMVGKNGLPVDMVAEMFGFETGLDMINGLVNLEPIKDVIKQRVEDRMLNEYSGLTDPRQQELQLQEALHNEARAKFLAIELKFLNKTMQPVRQQVVAARLVARDILSSMKLRDIRPTVFAQNEKRARKALEKAMRTGDVRGAIEAKRSELLNSQLAREAVEVQKHRDKFNKRIKDIFKYNEKTDSRESNYVNAAKEILTFFGEGPEIESDESYVSKLEKYDKDTFNEIDLVITSAKELPGREIKDLTAQDFDTLDEIIQSLWYQSRRTKQMRVEGKLIEKQVIKDDLIPKLQNMDQSASEDFGEAGETNFWERQIMKLEGIKSGLRRVESWCKSKDGEGSPRIIRGGGALGGGVLVSKEGEVAGSFTKYIWRVLKDPINKWRSERPKWTGRYVKLLEQVDFRKGLIKAPELVNNKGISYTFGRERGMGKAELLGAMLHTGNKSNLEKLIVGRGWGEFRDDGSLDTRKWDTFVDRMINEGYLTLKDFEFLQSVWDLNQEMLPLTQQAHKEVFGYYFKEIGATPIVNKFGTFRGGYVPAALDKNINRKELGLQQTLDNVREEMRYAVPAVPRGFTKPRTRSMKALSFNLGVQAQHMDNSLRFAYIQPAVTDLVRLFKDKEFSSALGRVDPTAIDKMLIPWLRNAASQRTTLGEDHFVNQAISAITRSTSLNYMFLSIKNGMQQITGLIPARLEIEHKYLNDAFRRYTREPHQMANEVAQMSPFMRDRQVNQMFDVQDQMNDLILNPQRFEKLQAWARKNGYVVQQFFQNYVDSVVWIAKYNQVSANAPTTMTEAQIQQEAIQQADGAVRMTQDSLLPEDVASYQIAEPFFKAMFQFTSYFNAQANLNSTQYKALIKEIGFTSKKFSGQMLFTFLFGLALPALVSEAIQEAAGGGLVDDDEDGFVDELFEFGFMSIARYGTAFVPLGSTLFMAPLNQIDSKRYNDRITLSPSISLINTTVQGTTRFIWNLPGVIKGEKEVSGYDVRSGLTALSLLTKFPTYFAAKPIGLLVDLKNGKWTPRGPLDLIRAIVTGQKGEGRN